MKINRTKCYLCKKSISGRYIEYNPSLYQSHIACMNCERELEVQNGVSYTVFTLNKYNPPEKITQSQKDFLIDMGVNKIPNTKHEASELIATIKRNLQ